MFGTVNYVTIQMKTNPCPRCGKTNPAEIHTCTPKVLKQKDFINKFLNGKCEEVMAQMPDECVDLIVTSPPYNLRNSTGNGMKDGRGGKWANAALLKGYAEAEYNDNLPHEEYVTWQRQCLASNDAYS